MNAGELSRQAGLVIQLVDSIVGLLVESNSRHYPGGTALFRDYVLKLGEATEVYVSGVVTAGSNEPKHVQSLATLTRLWRSLHTFVKPIADSHSLTYPYSLIEAFASILRSLETFGFSELQVAVFHTADFNYLQLQTSSLMNLSETIKGVIPGAPSFPQGLVLVGLPYSQQGSVDLNTLLMHELGHFVYQTVSDPRAKIVQCLEKLPRRGNLWVGQLG